MEHAEHGRQAAPLLQLNGVTKAYGPTKAVTAVDLILGRGEIVALVGENGAGKSTLMNILSGVIQPDSGVLRLDGSEARLSSPQEAQASGIATVFQELSLAANLTVAENIFAGRLPARFGFVDRKALEQASRALMDRLGLAIRPDSLVGDLPVSARQIVEIAKAASRNPKVLLLDEPTSALNADEKAALFGLVRRLRGQGVGIIYISHHLEEVMDLADRIIVLRDGSVVQVADKGTLSTAEVVRAMVGRLIADKQAEGPRTAGEIILSTSGLSDGKHVTDADLSIRRGEIVAIAGLMGSGRTELGEMLVGLRRPARGTIMMEGAPIQLRTLAAAIRRGIGYVPPERKSQGLFLDLSVGDNIAAATLRKQASMGLYRRSLVDQACRRNIDRLSIKVRSPSMPCRSLSGGNQQKVLFAKWLEVDPRLMVVEEPTKGVDIAAKQDIHTELQRLARSGTGIVLISSDLPEILAIADRILVMHKGRIVAELDPAHTTEHDIVARASGLAELAHAI